MLNCGLGIVFILFAAVMLLVKKGTVDSLLMMFIGYEDRIALVATAAICMITTMNDMAAPSVSLEGKNIWILQVLPVSGLAGLKGKAWLANHIQPDSNDISYYLCGMDLKACSSFCCSAPINGSFVYYYDGSFWVDL